MFKTSNPLFNKKSFGQTHVIDDANVMTINGTINKIIISILLVIIASTYVWNVVASHSIENLASAAQPYIYGGMIGGIVSMLVVIFAPSIRMITVPLYAICEGLFLGGLTAMVETFFPGIAMQAAGITFFILFAMLIAYRTGVIKVTKKLAAGIFAATAGIALFYIATWILGMFGLNMAIFHGTSLLALGITIVVAIVAALNLVLDFDLIVKGAEARAPKSMEWYGAFGLLVTLVWLYVTILRLLLIIANRN